MIELKECSRLRANITARQCEINRKGLAYIPNKQTAVAPCFVCNDCPGLGVTVQEIKEETALEKKICSVNGCDSFVHARGMCWKHEKSELGINPNTGKPLDKKVLKVVKADAKVAAPKPATPATPPPVEETICQTCGVFPCCCHIISAPDVADQLAKAPIESSEVTLSDMGLEIDQLFSTKRQEWLFDLQGATTVRSRAKLFLRMCEQLEGMAY